MTHRKIRRHNPMALLVRDPMFRKRVEKKLKGRSSYSRKPKHSGKDI